MSTPGRKKGIFAQQQAKAGQPRANSALSGSAVVRASLRVKRPDVSVADRCYERGGSEFRWRVAGVLKSSVAQILITIS